MFDIGPAELIVLVVAAVLLFGPEKLPDLARKAARVIAYVRNIANNAQAQISTELGPGFEDFDIRDPKGSIRRHIMDQVEPLVADVQAEIEESKKTFADTTEDLKSFRDELEDIKLDETPAPGPEHEPADDGSAVDDELVDDELVDDELVDDELAEDEPVDEPAVLVGAPFDPDAT